MRPDAACGKIRCQATIERELRARGFTDVRVCGMEPDFIERALRGSAEPPAPSLEVDLLL